MNSIRRCTLAVLLALLAACSNIQAPNAAETPVITSSTVSVDYDLLTPKDLRVSQAISAKYRCKPEVAAKVVQQASTHAYMDFPTRDDILAIIALESRFNPFAKQGGSFGLMQVLTRTHRGLIRDKDSISDQVRVGTHILRQYYLDTGKSRRAAVMSYNVGPGAYKKGVRATKYYDSYSDKLNWIKSQYKVQTF